MRYVRSRNRRAMQQLLLGAAPTPSNPDTTVVYYPLQISPQEIMAASARQLKVDQLELDFSRDQDLQKVRRVEALALLLKQQRLARRRSEVSRDAVSRSSTVCCALEPRWLYLRSRCAVVLWDHWHLPSGWSLTSSTLTSDGWICVPD